jgi:hypothetical protein
MHVFLHGQSSFASASGHRQDVAIAYE